MDALHLGVSFAADTTEAEVDAAAAAGCDTARVRVDWPVVEPAEGRVDTEAVAAVRRLVARCHRAGLEPTLTLHGRAAPAWLGDEPWLAADAPERFVRWAAVALDAWGDVATRWVAVDQLNAVALRSYLAGSHAPGRRLSAGGTIRALDHVLAAHVLAHDALKAGQPAATVALALRSVPVYELDRLCADLVLARGAGVPRAELGAWLRGRRVAHDRAWPAATPATRAARRVARSVVPLEQALARTVAAVYASPHTRAADELHVWGEGAGMGEVLPALGWVRWRRPAPAPLADRVPPSAGLPVWLVGGTPPEGEAAGVPLAGHVASKAYAVSPAQRL